MWSATDAFYFVWKKVAGDISIRRYYVSDCRR